jgi:hypothetical protein
LKKINISFNTFNCSFYRILCLKVFDNIIIKSQTKDNQGKKGQSVNIDFNQNFTANVLNDIEKSEHSSADSYTTTTFKNISNFVIFLSDAP